MADKKVIFSGIQPSGGLTLGNYIGALRQWVKLQDEYYCHYCVVDMHAITVRQEAEELRRRCGEVFAMLLSCGIDPNKSALFYQSHVSAHAELAWVLNCHTYMGELMRMTQFKDKSKRHEDNINAGLFTYPVLMAADILLYQTNLVPVGEDQRQHLELSRDIAIRFNNAYGETFAVPDGYIPKVGGRVMSLADPLKKMSKSDSNENAYIALLDTPEVIMHKFKRAVTDSENRIEYAESTGVGNLLAIYSACAGVSIDAAEKEFSGQGYGTLKTRTAEAVIALLEPIQKRYAQLMGDPAELERVMRESEAKATQTARKTLRDVYAKIGFALPPQALCASSPIGGA